MTQRMHTHSLLLCMEDWFGSGVNVETQTGVSALVYVHKLLQSIQTELQTQKELVLRTQVSGVDKHQKRTSTMLRLLKSWLLLLSQHIT